MSRTDEAQRHRSDGPRRTRGRSINWVDRGALPGPCAPPPIPFRPSVPPSRPRPVPAGRTPVNDAFVPRSSTLCATLLGSTSSRPVPLQSTKPRPKGLLPTEFLSISSPTPRAAPIAVQTRQFLRTTMHVWDASRAPSRRARSRLAWGQHYLRRSSGPFVSRQPARIRRGAAQSLARQPFGTALGQREMADDPGLAAAHRLEEVDELPALGAPVDPLLDELTLGERSRHAVGRAA